MSKLTDRVSFLKGLAEGMQIDKDKNSNKLLMEIISILDDMAKEMAEMTEAHDELNEYVESIDDDLADLEEVLFGEDEDACGCGCEDCNDDCNCDDCDDDEDDEDEDSEMISYSCPHCNHEILFDASTVDFDEDYLCPACGKPVFPEVADEDEDDNE